MKHSWGEPSPWCETETISVEWGGQVEGVGTADHPPALNTSTLFPSLQQTAPLHHISCTKETPSPWGPSTFSCLCSTPSCQPPVCCSLWFSLSATVNLYSWCSYGCSLLLCSFKCTVYLWTIWIFFFMMGMNLTCIPNLTCGSFARLKLLVWTNESEPAIWPTDLMCSPDPSDPICGI